MLILIVTFGVLHGFIMMPVLLSLIGPKNKMPKSNKTGEKPEEEAEDV